MGDENNKKCMDLAREIKELETKISKREGPFNNGIKLEIPLRDKVTEENEEKLHKLKKEYNRLCE